MQILRSVTEILGSARDFWVLLKSPPPALRFWGQERRFWVPVGDFGHRALRAAKNLQYPEITQNYPNQPHWLLSPGVEKKTTKKKNPIRDDDVIATPTLSCIWVNFCRNWPPWQQGGQERPKIAVSVPVLVPFGVFWRGGRRGSLWDRCGAINNQWDRLWAGAVTRRIDSQWER